MSDEGPNEDRDELEALADLLRSSERSWRELAPFREAALVHFTDPELRATLQRMGEATLDRAIEFERGPDYGELPVMAMFRALHADLWHAWGFAVTVVATPRLAQATEEEHRLCEQSRPLLRLLKQATDELERLLGPPPPTQPRQADRAKAN
ncbi:MAG TPA: hypothetical protein VN851_19815 [Thermoanaerobaculia bacterium]|nr:hypothetical protein [Thermoanaerobaculia bacterium]